VILSLIGGVVIPFVYACIFGPLSLYIHNPYLKMVLEMPVRWPVFLAYYLSPSFLHLLYTNDTAFLIMGIGSDIALYTLLTYCALWLFSIRRRIPQSESPPPPPPLSDMN